MRKFITVGFFVDNDLKDDAQRVWEEKLRQAIRDNQQLSKEFGLKFDSLFCTGDNVSAFSEPVIGGFRKHPGRPATGDDWMGRSIVDDYEYEPIIKLPGEFTDCFKGLLKKES